ncbi:hypothetical protein, partial [Candidatus Frankia alpina]|uniref:hypothetical protein n=1 Tax=Candidatus Frankia alpina TaxID=2699483 RepID=UPI0013D3AD20
ACGHDLLFAPVDETGLLVPHQLAVEQAQGRDRTVARVAVLQRLAALGELEEAVGEILLGLWIGGLDAAQEVSQRRPVGRGRVSGHPEQFAAGTEDVHGR